MGFAWSGDSNYGWASKTHTVVPVVVGGVLFIVCLIYGTLRSSQHKFEAILTLNPRMEGHKDRLPRPSPLPERTQLPPLHDPHRC